LVSQKTQKLKDANTALEILYQSARKLTQNPHDTQQLEKYLLKLQQKLTLGTVVIRLNDSNYIKTLPQALSQRTKVNSKPQIYPISIGEKDYGQIELSHPIEGDNWESQVLSSMADNIAMALELERKAEQENRLIILDERSVIARELHDSIAQSLSYLKIQMRILQTQLQKDSDKNKLEATIKDIREGINSAYQQLRELITTFRLKLDVEGLQPALQSTTIEYRKKLKIPIHLNYQLAQVRFTPNEEMHILHIVREALSNITKHSKASEIAICGKISDDENFVEISVIDNGVGFSKPSTEHHYGITFMQERASSLGAELVIEERLSGGVEVNLKFIPTNR